MGNKKEYILCAAIKLFVSNSIVCGHRHSDCIQLFCSITGYKITSLDEQGFLTSKNRFVDRREAARIAFEAGQVAELSDCLISEELY